MMLDPILDAGIFDRLFTLPGKVGHKLLAMFLRSAPVKLEAMTSALKAGEFERVKDIAHIFISSAGTLGIVQMQLLAERIQYAVEERRDAEVAPLVTEIIAAYERALPLIEARRPPEVHTP